MVNRRRSLKLPVVWIQNRSRARKAPRCPRICLTPRRVLVMDQISRVMKLAEQNLLICPLFCLAILRILRLLYANKVQSAARYHHTRS